MTIAENIAQVEGKIDAACRGASRARQGVRLMAVTKMHSAEAILEAYAAGLRLFGENRVQEFAGKQAALSAAGILTAGSQAAFHCIGPVQSNKAARAAQMFDAIDTLDSLPLAERLNRAAGAGGRVLHVLLEIKLSPEDAKHGIAPESAALAELCERLPDFDHLRVSGLMTVPPYAEDAEQARPYFAHLRRLRDALAQRFPKLALDELSMGMSHDFAVAIEEGATVVRVGTAIFGARDRKPLSKPVRI